MKLYRPHSYTIPSFSKSFSSGVVISSLCVYKTHNKYFSCSFFENICYSYDDFNFMLFREYQNSRFFIRSINV